jgi:RNA polymerase sigma-70 factor (ECF subfamily)
MRKKPFQCVITAWQQYESDIKNWLLVQTKQADFADDILQETFIKAMKAGEDFCQLSNPKSWLFKVAHNSVVDHYRLAKKNLAIDENMPDIKLLQNSPISELDVCIARNLPFLSDDDRDVIEQCDLGNVKQACYSQQKNISLAATKSRLKRARHRLRKRLIQQCQIQYDESGEIFCHKSKN